MDTLKVVTKGATAPRSEVAVEGGSGLAYSALEPAEFSLSAHFRITAPIFTSHRSVPDPTPTTDNGSLVRPHAVSGMQSQPA